MARRGIKETVNVGGLPPAKTTRRAPREDRRVSQDVPVRPPISVEVSRVVPGVIESVKLTLEVTDPTPVPTKSKKRKARGKR